MATQQRSVGASARRSAPGNGFTLVEILVVMAIVSVMIAMLLPGLARGREAARRIMCGNNTRSLGTATLVYSSDYEGYVPDNLAQAHKGRYRFSPDNRRDLYLNYGVSPWETWFCPSSVARGDNYLTKVIAVTKGRWIYDRDLVYTGVAWLNGNRSYNGYGYWVGLLRGYARGSANAATYSYDLTLRITDTSFPSRRVVWGEIISPNGSLGATGWSPPANGHTREDGRECDGGWFGMVDNSVAWRRVEFGVNTFEDKFQRFAYKN